MSDPTTGKLALPPMSCSATPKTDAILRSLRENNYDTAQWISILTATARKLECEHAELREKYRMHHAEAERLTEVVRAATVLIAAKGRNNTMLAYQGLRSALHPQTLTGQRPAETNLNSTKNVSN